MYLQTTLKVCLECVAALLRIYNVVSGNKKRHENYEARLVFRNVSSKLN